MLLIIKQYFNMSRCDYSNPMININLLHSCHAILCPHMIVVRHANKMVLFLFGLYVFLWYIGCINHLWVTYLEWSGGEVVICECSANTMLNNGLL